MKGAIYIYARRVHASSMASRSMNKVCAVAPFCNPIWPLVEVVRCGVGCSRDRGVVVLYNGRVIIGVGLKFYQ